MGCFASVLGIVSVVRVLTICGFLILLHKNVTLPQAEFSKPFHTDLVASGFGLAPPTKEFKVVIVFFYSEEPEARLLTLGSNSWRSIGDAPPNLTMMFGLQVLLDGYVYWLNISTSLVGPYIGITTFDLESEIFGSIPVPHFGFRTHLSQILVLRQLLYN